MSATKTKVSKNGAVRIPKRLRERCGIREGSEVTVQEWNGGVLITPKPLTEEALVELDMMKWSEEIDERIKQELEDCVEAGILTDEDFTHGTTRLR